MKKQANALAAWSILLGAVLVCLEVFVLRGRAGDMAAGMLLGIGWGLVGGGAAWVLTRRMREKAAYAAWYVTLLAVTVLALVLVALDYKAPCFLALGLMGVHIAGYFAAMAVLGRKM